jgi:hypothetical protein
VAIFLSEIEWFIRLRAELRNVYWNEMSCYFIIDSLVLTATGRIVVAGIGGTFLIENRQANYLIYGDGEGKDIGQNKTSFLRLQDDGVSAEGTAPLPDWTQEIRIAGARTGLLFNFEANKRVTAFVIDL